VPEKTSDASYRQQDKASGTSEPVVRYQNGAIPPPALSGRLRSTVNLHQTIPTENKTPESSTVETTDIHPTTPDHAFTIEELQKAWNNFVSMRANNGSQMGEQVALNRIFELNGTIISLNLDNQFQETLLNDVKPELLGYLRKTLQNRQIQLQHQVLASDVKRNPYTPQERFNVLVEKNPHLLQLQQALGLEVEF